MFRSSSIYLTVHSRISTLFGCNGFYAPAIVVNRIRSGRCDYLQICHKSFKRYLDFSNVPKLNEADLEEQFVKGSGPGGQAVNKTNNAVVLKHIPTGLVVKCHETRSQWDNKQRAREMMVTKLDNLLNNEQSIESQIRILEEKYQTRELYKKKKLSELKKAFQEREGLT